jgi:hypothetical protein
MERLVPLQLLPIGDPSFDTIIDDNLLYADKTKYIYDLINSKRKAFFLSRPRRFGKTLLLRTLKELFSGNSERFNNLWIGQSDYTFPRHPVLDLSLALTTPSPEILKTSLLGQLHEIADFNHLNVSGDSPEVFFGGLIKSLRWHHKSKVVVLIDEYDAPVTRNMADMKVAKANAAVLHDFFAVMKTISVSDCIHFSLVTGITRYALTSMDSGPNHLVDISLAPEYAGICGFTLEEFGPLFADRMEPALASLKAAGVMPPSADLADLNSEIHFWYDGYNWGGQTRVLNPYSILNFFDQNVFRQYWILSGRPSHLTSLIQAKPLDFINTKLTSYLSIDLRKSDLTQLQALPILFHSGYLTIDTIKYLQASNSDLPGMKLEEFATFKLPNFEVESMYLNDCFKAIFNIHSNDNFVTWRNELQQAFLDRDAQAVSDRFNKLLSPITYHQRMKEEETFHIVVQSILSTMGFKVLSEVPGSKGRLDLAIELPGEIYVIIELKYCQNKVDLNDNEEINALSLYAIDYLSPEIVDSGIANALKKKISKSELYSIYRKYDVDLNNNKEKNSILSSIAKDYLSELEFDTALALTVKNNLPKSSVDDILREASQSKLSKEQIDAKLTTAVADALTQIENRRYHGPFELQAKEFIDLGLALYGDGLTVKAAFRPKQP